MTAASNPPFRVSSPEEIEACLSGFPPTARVLVVEVQNADELFGPTSEPGTGPRYLVREGQAVCQLPRVLLAPQSSVQDVQPLALEQGEPA